MSWLNTVAVAISAPLDVDITAASAAASTRPASTRRQLHLDELGERVVAGLQRRQQDLGRHPYHRAGHRIQQAIHARSGAGPARYPRAPGGEHPLPDVLTDQQPEGVGGKVGQYLLAAIAVSEVASAGNFSARPDIPPVLYSASGNRMKKMPMVLTMNCTKSVSVIDHMPPSVE